MRRRLRLLLVAPRLPRRGVTAAQATGGSCSRARAAPRDHAARLPRCGRRGRRAELPPGLAAVHTRAPRGVPARRSPRAPAAGGRAAGSSYPGFARPSPAGSRRDALRPRPVRVRRDGAPDASGRPPPTILTVHQLGFAQELARWRADGRRAPRRRRALSIAICATSTSSSAPSRGVTTCHDVGGGSPRACARFLPDLPVSVSPVRRRLRVTAARRRRRRRAAPTSSSSATSTIRRTATPSASSCATSCPASAGPSGSASSATALPAEVAGARRLPAAVEAVGPVADVPPGARRRAPSSSRPSASAPACAARCSRRSPWRGRSSRRRVGAEGLGAPPDATCSSPTAAEAFAAAVRRVLDDPASRRAPRRCAGRALVESALRLGRDRRRARRDLRRACSRDPRAPTAGAAGARAHASRGSRAGLGYLPALALGAGLLGTRAPPLAPPPRRAGAAGAPAHAAPAAAGSGSRRHDDRRDRRHLHARPRRPPRARGRAARSPRGGAPAADVLVVDNASTDATPAVLRELVARTAGPRSASAHEPQLGLSAARNRGLAEARGDDRRLPRRRRRAAPGLARRAARAVRRSRRRLRRGTHRARASPGTPAALAHARAARGASARTISATAPRRLRYRPGDVYPFGANISFRVADARAAGGFSTAVGPLGRRQLVHDETDLCFRLDQRRPRDPLRAGRPSSTTSSSPSA